jgi:hypothetical protein
MFSGKTIFETMNKEDWKIYYQDISLSVLTSQNLFKKFFKKELGDNLKNLKEFHKDAKNGTLPKYSFIEPVYFTNGEHIGILN